MLNTCILRNEHNKKYIANQDFNSLSKMGSNLHFSDAHPLIVSLAMTRIDFCSQKKKKSHLMESEEVIRNSCSEVIGKNGLHMGFRYVYTLRCAVMIALVRSQVD